MVMLEALQLRGLLAARSRAKLLSARFELRCLLFAL